LIRSQQATEHVSAKALLPAPIEASQSRGSATAIATVEEPPDWASILKRCISDIETGSNGIAREE
jgi:hypothetical protein